MPWHQHGGAIGAGGNQLDLDETNWLGTRNAAPLRIITQNGGGMDNDRPNPEAEVMRITTAAQGRRVGIGAKEPQVKLHVVGDGIRLTNVARNRSLDMRADGNALDLQSNDAALFINNNGRQVHIRNLVRPSSRDLKENIVDFTAQEAIKALDGLKPSCFSWKDDEEKTRRLGFVAEDTPEIATSPDKRAVIPMHILAILSKVVQEQQRTIDSMRRALGLQDAT